MGLKSFFGKLAGGGGGGDKEGDPVEYKGYVIRPRPKSQGSQYYTAGVISKEFPEGTKEQYFIRADTHGSYDVACEHAATKAQQIIDEQGDRLFRD